MTTDHRSCHPDGSPAHGTPHPCNELRHYLQKCHAAGCPFEMFAVRKTPVSEHDHRQVKDRFRREMFRHVNANTDIEIQDAGFDAASRVLAETLALRWAPSYAKTLADQIIRLVLRAYFDGKENAKPRHR